MKKIRDKIEHYVLKMENHWKVLPIAKQRLLTKVFFGGYVLLTIIVIINVFISTGQRRNTISINHIDGFLRKLSEKNQNVMR